MLAMKFLSVLALGATASTVLGASLPVDTSVEKFLVELAPGETRWVTEDEKWELKRNGQDFFDITDEAPGFTASTVQAPVAYPTTIRHSKAVNAMIATLSKENMMRDLTKLSSFHNRYYKSDYGKQSATWLQQQVQAAITASGADKYGAKVASFQNNFLQHSIIATIPGRSAELVIVGAHQDSINGRSPMTGRAPGADDNGSGSVTILEAMRGLLQDPNVVQGKAANTIEFHWYAGEEAGLLGSQAIFAKYKQTGKKVKAMLNQDMTGYIKGMLDKGLKESFGIITDNVNASLTTFVRMVIKKYCQIPTIDSRCGYACSDHASANRNGYPSAMVAESPIDLLDPHLHTDSDNISYLSFDHMIQHAKLVVGFVTELSM
ncbi:leucyl aminopeptidase [Arthroderma uncinatum]|uniref:leucyl aminopeptidase n=1 Tax=Arthroderma uncinatum TaxID=74035 RepID=UPI00144A4FD1|nr:leucyl aminopeptidase [Arthroderma uncinatum]KAF3480789.1 leucyl aminopeptidase [Arthroderma uncinatum]